jgi:hypothetical protein
MSKGKFQALVLSSVAMTHRIGGWVLLLTVLGGLAAVDCDDDDHWRCMPGVPCPCRGGPACYLDCSDIDHCMPVCESTDECRVLCGDHCVYDCHSIRWCEVDCSQGCSVRCESVSTCDADVGPGSTVDCTNLSHCDVRCTADCEVHCASYSSCEVWCNSTNSAAQECSSERRVCGLPC